MRCGPNRNCPCLMLMVAIPQTANASMLYYAQTLIADFIQSAAQAEYASVSVSGCSTFTSVYPSSQSVLDSGAYTFCSCGDDIYGLARGVSGTSTTSWCKGIEATPSGFTQVSTTTHAAKTATQQSINPSAVASSILVIPPPITTTTSTSSTKNPGEPYSLTCAAPFC
ncbi:uncharacterized protein LY89DRAFT_63047 [Mollisia scopiformis]|uniref:Uncharacterized protein n=1 Tax=Mollisia scopiformis TaxID=149040 RepID=A0A194XAB1_MOLSC|nr:uncharacterized protein LY89DRAFT_63047 [Mollisia scopiformis]KUJ16702.1 hypothetical protein LY89DRAFT_63047 [Mollisia scopiformis]